MAADESALVPLSPDDTIDAIVSKVRGTGATNVELLVPDGTTVLQTLGGFERLRQTLAADRVDLLVISSDEKTLNAARLSQVETLGVQGARVTSPTSTNGGAADRYATQALPAEPLDERDAAFLSALDQVQPNDRYADLQAEDAELFAALDDLSDTMQQSGASSRRTGSISDDRGLGADEDFAASLDEWSELSADQAPTRASARPGRDLEPEPSRRFSAADFDLTEEDKRRQRGGRRTTAQRARAEAKGAAAGTAARRQRGGAAGWLRDFDEEDAAAVPRRGRSSALIVLAIVLAVILALAFWFLSSRVTITVAPPASAAGEYPFQNEVIPHRPLGQASSTAIQAVPVSADAEASVTGRVERETLSPAGTAQGQVTIINTIESAVPIPKGAEFIGKNAKGEDVRFTLDADALVPPAATTSSTTGRSTTYGQMIVGVTARSPGSASNVGANSITQLLIPGQQPIVSQNSNFIFQNAPIGGGSEQPQRIVTEADVQAVLGEALTSLSSVGVQQLRSQIDEAQAGIDASTITPSIDDLADPKNYDPPVVEPPIGQVVDPNNPIFRVTVRSRFNALATPAGLSVADQLQTVAPQYFFQRANRPCKASERQGTRVDTAKWDGEKLTISGVVSCTPIEGLAPETVGKVKDAVLGQTRDAAAAGLQTLQTQGVIGEYQLPDKASFPRFDWLITIQVAEPPPAAPQPTQGMPQ